MARKEESNSYSHHAMINWVKLMPMMVNGMKMVPSSGLNKNYSAPQFKFTTSTPSHWKTALDQIMIEHSFRLKL